MALSESMKARFPDLAAVSDRNTANFISAIATTIAKETDAIKDAIAAKVEAKDAEEMATKELLRAAVEEAEGRMRREVEKLEDQTEGRVQRLVREVEDRIKGAAGGQGKNGIQNVRKRVPPKHA